ncbi:MAG: DUF1727 domain-containing protein [Oscillospiraceae bacterium]|nr:DUF1727 domain-containing protein [Oscillospiraceae bacterium]
MNIRLMVAIAACKICRVLLRLFRRGGTSLPGKIALAIYPDVLRRCSCGMKIILVSGTNGKTTTCRIIEQGLRAAGIDVMANRSGANLLAGICAEFVANSSMQGKAQKQTAVIECDEAALKLVIEHLSPAVLVVTNIFRDQLDRYGEIMNTRNGMRTAIEKNSSMTLCLNADDSLVVSLADSLENPCLYFGVDEGEASIASEEKSDALYCIRCRHKYSYGYKTYGHLGDFSCPECGYARPERQISAKHIIAMYDDYSLIDMSIFGQCHEQKIPLPAVYNIYNSLAAATGLHSLGLSLPDFGDEADQVYGFGRMEKFNIGNGATMILVKNPAGFTQVINYLSTLNCGYDLMCCLDDRLADGEDISWIWDVPFEKLAEHERLIGNIYTSGRRREDMFLRLKYAGFDPAKLKEIKDDRSFAAKLECRTRPLFILPTYSAMMRLRPVLAKKSRSKDFWE